MNLKEFNLQFIKNDNVIYNQKLKNNSHSLNILQFYLFDYLTTIDLLNQILIRENDDFKFTLDFLNQNCLIFLKSEELEVPVNVEYSFFQNDQSKITIEYQIESDDSKTKLTIF